MRKLLVLFIALSISLSTLARKVTITFAATPDEIFTKQILKEFFKKNPRPALLLRVPNSSSTVSRSEDNGLLNNIEFYSYIEKCFLKNDFTLRDRAIFEKIVSQGNVEMDYSKMSALTNTDIVLEIVSISTEEYHTNEVEKKGEQKVYGGCDFKGFFGWKVVFKIVKVKENEVVGLYTFHKTPCTKGCEFELGHSCNLISPKVPVKDKDGKPIPFAYKVNLDGDKLERFATEITERMIAEMK